MNRRQVGALQGKIHIYVADGDPFLLDVPVRAFQRVLAVKGLRADIRFLAEAGHAVWSDELRKSIHEEMDRVVRAAPAGASLERGF